MTFALSGLAGARGCGRLRRDGALRRTAAARDGAAHRAWRQAGERRAHGASANGRDARSRRRDWRRRCVGLLAGFIRAMLFDTPPTDGLSFGLAILAIVTSAALATLVPLYRATHVDPAVALRGE